MKTIKNLSLLVVLLVALFLRLYKIDNPVADWHSFRQADTASVTRNFVERGVNLLVPTYHDLSNIQSGKENPNGYRMVEFPLYNLLHFYTYQAFPTLGLDMAGRLTSVLLSLLSIALVFKITNKLSGWFIAITGSIFMAILPFNVFYSRVILPEPLMIASFLASFWFLIEATDEKSSKKRLFLFFSAIFFSISMLVKPFSAFFALPHLAILIRTWANKKINFFDILTYGLIALAPFFLWRKHIMLFPEGIPASDWLYNDNGIRFRPAWFRWLFGERLGKLILGVFGTTFLSLGLIAKPQKEGITYWLWAIGIFLYFSVIAGGNVRHDYYQAIIIPFMAIILAKGFYLLIGLTKSTYSRFLTLVMAFIIFVSMISLSWYEIKGYYQINNSAIIEAGIEADRLLPKDAKVIAPYFGDTAFLYQTRRSGWPIGYYIDQKIKMGATHYVGVVYDDEPRELEMKYKVLSKTDKYVIIDLTQSL